MPIDPDVQKELDDIKKLIRSEAVGGLLLLMFFMSCSQCSKLDTIESKVDSVKNKVSHIEDNLPQR